MPSMYLGSVAREFRCDWSNCHERFDQTPGAKVCIMIKGEPHAYCASHAKKLRDAEIPLKSVAEVNKKDEPEVVETPRPAVDHDALFIASLKKQLGME